MGTFRALIADCVPTEAQNQACAFSGLMNGGAFLLCNAIMLIFYETSSNKDDQNAMYLELYPILSVIAALATVVLCIPTIIIAEEKPQSKKDLAANQNVFKQLFTTFKRMDRIFYLAMLPLVLAWVGYTPIQQFTGTIFGI